MVTTKAREFVYLAVILDAYSRKIVGWELDETMTDALTLAALRMAIRDRQPPPQLIHHTDRGGQYGNPRHQRSWRPEPSG